MRKPKSRPKHVREVIAFLVRLGATAIEVATHRRYILTCRVGGLDLRLNLPLSPGGNAVAQAMGNVRRELRQHGFLVPA